MDLKIEVKRIEHECALALAPLGVNMRQGTGSIAINEEFFGWIGLNSGQHNQFIRINPFIGLHCPAIMKLTAAAGGKKYCPNEVATYSVFLGTLCPHVKQFIFNEEVDIEYEARRMASVIGEFGLPYMNEISNFPSLLPLLKERVPSLGGYPQRYAAALHLSGNTEEAIVFIEQQIALFQQDGENDLIATMKKLRKLMHVN
ncbi:hypothetical protein [Massilia sp. Root418]|jgi:hypothetical protein|uniref:hypothetical protein n=1 Tax=Massilia sp. Root418 TaxID=1736532 RepID=UPI000AA57BA7|nr:hypothetical protein [Massilia sp. Root418]